MPDGREPNRRGDVCDASYFLSYKRDDDGKPGLIVECYVAKTDEEGNEVFDDPRDDKPASELVWVRRLEKVNRELRVAAITMLPEFIGELTKKAETAVASLRENMVKARATVDELKAALAGNIDRPRPGTGASL